MRTHPLASTSLSPVALCLALLCAAATAHAGESMRCGKWVVTSEVTVDELLSKCGQPSSKEVSTSDIYGAGAQPGRTRKVGQSTTEYWTYDRGTRSFRMIVTIADGKITNLARAE